MSGRTTTRPTATCVNCGFEAQSGSDEWETARHTLGTLTQCPECGSTDVLTRG